MDLSALMSAVEDGRLSYETRKLARRERVYSFGEIDSCVYLVQAGFLKTSTFSRDGRECLLSVYGPGDVFGEESLVPGARNETVTAMRPAIVRQIESKDLLASLIHEDLLRGIIECLTHRLAEQQRAITNLLTLNSEQRLALALLELARKMGKRNGRGLRIDERITHTELSGMVGTTRSRIGFFLKQFQELGLVEPAREAFLVVHEQRLARFCGLR